MDSRVVKYVTTLSTMAEWGDQHDLAKSKYSKPCRSRIQVDRQNYPSDAKIRLMRSDIKGFGTIVSEIYAICGDPTYASPTYARFTVIRIFFCGLVQRLRR